MKKTSKIKVDFKKIQRETEKKYLVDKYRAICELIKDLEIQKIFLQSVEGYQAAKNVSGEVEVQRTLKNCETLLEMRKVEKAFLENYVNGKTFIPYDAGNAENEKKDENGQRDEKNDVGKERV